MVEGDHVHLKRIAGDFLSLDSHHIPDPVSRVDDVIADRKFEVALGGHRDLILLIQAAHDERPERRNALKNETKAHRLRKEGDPAA